MRHPSQASTSSTSPPISKPTPCCTKVGLKRGPWTTEEDEVLANYIRKDGEGRWRTLPKRAGLLRCGKSCRLRWMNYLRPNVKRGHIAPDEEDLILRLHRLLGNRWSLIAGRIPGRTDNEIKNYWNTHLSKKLISQGIDPRTHKPLITTTTSSPPSSDQDKPSSSSKATNYHALNPNPNPNLVTTALEDQVLNKGNNGYYHGSVILQNSDVSGIGNEEQDDDEINYCGTDDVFMSSFLNSLINEDGFNAQHQLHQMGSSIGIITAAAAAAAAGGSSDPLMSHPSTFAFGAGWENPIMSSGYNGFNQNETNKFTHDPPSLATCIDSISAFIKLDSVLVCHFANYIHMVHALIYLALENFINSMQMSSSYQPSLWSLYYDPKIFGADLDYPPEKLEPRKLCFWRNPFGDALSFSANCIVDTMIK